MVTFTVFCRFLAPLRIRGRGRDMRLLFLSRASLPAFFGHCRMTDGRSESVRLLCLLTLIGTFGIFPQSTVPKIPPTIEDHIPSPDDHQDGMQPPCPPQNIFSIYVPWPVSRHSEPLVTETRESRLLARAVGRP